MRIAVRVAPITRVTGALLMLFSVAQLLPIAVALLYDEDTTTPFLAAFGITLSIGLGLWFGSRIPAPGSGGRGAQAPRMEMRSREGFLITVLFYLGLGLTGAIPMLLAPGATGSFTNAAFESLSGLTTTGATVMAGLDDQIGRAHV